MTGLELAYIGIPTIFITAEKFELETAKLLEKHGFGKIWDLVEILNKIS